MAQAHLDLHHTAKLARLQLTDAEMAKFTTQIEGILDYMRTLEAHDLTNVEPTAHAMPVFDVWREDVSRESFTNAEALANAPKKLQGQFLMPRVVEELRGRLLVFRFPCSADFAY